MKFKKILAPIDFSPMSQAALEQAAKLANDNDAELTLVHVHPIETAAFMDFTYVESPEQVQEICDQAEKKLAEWRDALSEPPKKSQLRVVTGHAIDSIIELSKDHDLVVMSTHGRSGLKHFLLGSVAERIVQAAHCSVLVVRP